MIVTISRVYGCSALAIAERVADRLGYTLVDKQLPAAVATRLGVSREAAEAIDAGPPPLAERLLQGLAIAAPEGVSPNPPRLNDIDAAFVRELEHAVREFATHGDCVFLGRVAGRVLRDHGGVLRVFICAPSEWRVTHLIAALGLDERTARSEIQRIDAAREEYARTWYDVELADARNYDLTLDSSRYGVDGSVELILAALHAGADPA